MADPMDRAKDRITLSHPVKILKRPKSGKTIKVPRRSRNRG